jgi:DNA-3-methyladenine glycosylase II
VATAKKSATAKRGKAPATGKAPKPAKKATGGAPAPRTLVTESSGTFTLPTRGPFSLEELATFGFGHNTVTEFDGVMRMAFCLDGSTGAGSRYGTHVGVAVRQDGDELHCTAYGSDDLDRISAQVARVLSVDHDGDEFVKIGRRDPVLAKLLEAAPGLRPPLFYSPYEAAVWSIISARRPRRQGAMLRVRLGLSEGTTFAIAGEDTPALPTPERLLSIDAFQGVPPDRIERLHSVAQAALDGLLDVDHLTAMEPEAAMEELQQLKGIGPFYSALVVIRACGLADVLPTMESMALDLVGTLYDRPSVSVADFEELAERWRPFRTWAVVLIRAAAWRILPPDQLPERERRDRARRAKNAKAPKK